MTIYQSPLEDFSIPEVELRYSVPSAYESMSASTGRNKICSLRTAYTPSKT